MQPKSFLGYIKLFLYDSRVYIACLIIGFILGFIVGKNIYDKPPKVIKEVTVVTDNNAKKDKESVKVDVDLTTKTTGKVDYVKKDTYIKQTSDGKYKEYVEKTDVDIQAGKPSINVKVNDKSIEVKKAEDEKYVFDKNKLTYTQSSNINLSIETKPVYIDKTKYFGIGVYTNGKKSGTMYAFDFPIAKKINLNGNVMYNPHEKKGYAGISMRF